MNPAGSQDFFYKFSLACSLFVLLLMSYNAPISGDEYVHVAQAEKNIKFLSTCGKDKTALDTPISRLKHYGQSFDTATTYLAQQFGIENLYRFRHLCNAVMAWLVILVSSSLTINMTDSKGAGIITVILFLITGRFTGHALNNLKDIPFAFAYIFGLFFMLRFAAKLPKISWKDLTFVALGAAMAVSIRIGGLLLTTYFILFVGLYIYYLLVSGALSERILPFILKMCGVSVLVLFVSYFLGMALWPFALENPLLNPWLSLDLMRDYPTTVRQIFEGKLYWSDQFPRYYLPKYLLITLPAAVPVGLAACLALIGRLRENSKIVLSIFILISFGFPIFFAAVSGANVYGGWRQLLFVFPPLAVLSSTGLWLFYQKVEKLKMARGMSVVVFLLLLWNPVRYSIVNYPYQYTFFNLFVGGAKGAYGNYELDYYFTSFNKAYAFIDSIAPDAETVAANFIIPEYYRDRRYAPKLIDYYHRSDEDWDFAVICNTFLSPASLKNGNWPPENAVFTESVDGVPILAVVERQDKIGFEGFRQLKAGEYKQAVETLTRALDNDSKNESLLINLATAYALSGNAEQAEQVLDRLEKVYPDNEPGADLKGELKLNDGKLEEAEAIFKKITDHNYKYFNAYVNLAKVYIEKGEPARARKYLSTCLKINPFYLPAYRIYGQLLIDSGENELGEKMLRYQPEGSGKYGN